MDRVEEKFLTARQRKRGRDIERHTETKLDLAEGDRERISEVERKLAEVCAWIEAERSKPQLLIPTNPNVPQVDDIQARVEAIEGFIQGMPELHATLAEFGALVMSLAEGQRAHHERMNKIGGRLEEFRSKMSAAMHDVISTTEELTRSVS